MFFSKSKERSLLAPTSGEVLPLSRVPDEVFSSGMLGEGVAIDPTDGVILSPVRGRVLSVTETGHAYTILSEDGLDVLIHIGIDTVSLKGEGFLSMVSVGDSVKAGDVLARVDLNLLRGKNYPTVIPVLITNPEKLQSKKINLGDVRGGIDPILRYKEKDG